MSFDDPPSAKAAIEWFDGKGTGISSNRFSNILTSLPLTCCCFFFFNYFQARILMANPLKYHLRLAELSSHREEVEEGAEEVCTDGAERDANVWFLNGCNCVGGYCCF